MLDTLTFTCPILINRSNNTSIIRRQFLHTANPHQHNAASFNGAARSARANWYRLDKEGYVQSVYRVRSEEGGIYIKYGLNSARRIQTARRHRANTTSIKVITKPNKFASLGDYYAALEYFLGSEFNLYEAHIHRIDYCADLNVNLQVVKSQLANTYKQTSWNIGTRAEPRTYYLGGMRSEEIIRVYDKKFEQWKKYGLTAIIGDLTRVEVSWQSHRYIADKMGRSGFLPILGNLRSYLNTFRFVDTEDWDEFGESIIEAICPFSNIGMYELIERIDLSSFITSELTPEILSLIQELEQARMHNQLLGMQDYLKKATRRERGRRVQILHNRTVRFRKLSMPTIDPSAVFIVSLSAFLER